MNYIVLDLEWNQAASPRSSVYNHLPIHLRGEIIQFGAVKLREDWTPGEEFQIDVKPVYFRKMHFKVKELTGLDSQRLRTACGFSEAFAQFRAFCGENCVFLTWGCDDKGILEQNIIVHDQDWDWIQRWVNLQVVYNYQTGGEGGQQSLSKAMEHFEIPQTRMAHDALGDAYNTALVCSHLDMYSGLENYDTAVRFLAVHTGGAGSAALLEHLLFTGYPSRRAAFASEAMQKIRCPVCAEIMTMRHWVNQGDRRYMSLCVCPEHGSYLLRVKLKYADNETWNINRILYRADDDMVHFYKSKAGTRRKYSRSRQVERGGARESAN